MNPDLDNVIRQAIKDAQAAGYDHIGQAVFAVQAMRSLHTVSLGARSMHGGLKTLQRLIKIVRYLSGFSILLLICQETILSRMQFGL